MNQLLRNWLAKKRFDTVRISVGAQVVCTARVADSFVTRLVGLLIDSAGSGHASLLLTKCRGIHTFGMPSAIDVVLLDCDARIIKAQTVCPGSAFFHVRSRQVLELPPGSVVNYGLKSGSQLVIAKSSSGGVIQRWIGSDVKE
ncbi:MAG: DUF192 domain-containing protein [Gammaproteobacteria bacterium]|nr:DUF192 domain-containing protein [Gammaproteobacteria bacterium]